MAAKVVARRYYTRIYEFFHVCVDWVVGCGSSFFRAGSSVMLMFRPLSEVVRKLTSFEFAKVTTVGS